MSYSRAVVLYEPHSDVRNLLEMVLADVNGVLFTCAKVSELSAQLDRASELANHVVLIADYYRNLRINELVENLKFASTTAYGWNGSQLRIILMIGGLDEGWEERIPTPTFGSIILKPLDLRDFLRQLEIEFHQLSHGVEIERAA